MASILKVDDLRGNTSAGDITITSEGGAATQSLQAGVVKVAYGFSQRSDTQNGITAGSSSDQALNISSYSDDATGQATININNAMSNQQYIFTSGMLATNNTSTVTGACTTTAIFLRINDADSGSAQDNLHYGKLTGDLA